MANQPLKETDPLKGKKSGKWMKYGGAISGLVKEKIVGNWICQSCGVDQPEELKPFLFEIGSGEYIRVCAECIHLANVKEIKSFRLLISITRHY